MKIPENLSKLLVDVTLTLLGKSGFNRIESGQVADLVDRTRRKKYDGMFEAVIESYWEGRE